METKPEVPTLAGFAAWLETQPPGARYDYLNARKCAAARYFESIGRKYSVAIPDPDGPETSRIEFAAVRASNPTLGYKSTYGDALKVARDMLAGKDVTA